MAPTTRLWSSGMTAASQAAYTGSIPVRRTERGRVAARAKARPCPLEAKPDSVRASEPGEGAAADQPARSAGWVYGFDSRQARADVPSPVDVRTAPGIV